jgi:hypothetical protein
MPAAPPGAAHEDPRVRRKIALGHSYPELRRPRWRQDDQADLHPEGRQGAGEMMEILGVAGGISIRVLRADDADPAWQVSIGGTGRDARPVCRLLWAHAAAPVGGSPARTMLATGQ